ncbi:GTP-binding protein Rheb-like [Diadema antillarum]|uniref:GTP-binding protein Rheb-like n=1 Tax=Diadema antillarum TaxID=105358 RepID=UPI003A8542AA
MTISPHIKSTLRSVQKTKDRERAVTFSAVKPDHSPILRTDKTDKHNFRLVLLGQDGVGKSAISVRFLCGRYLHEYDPTLESCYEKLETIDGRLTKVELYDTANQSSLEDYLVEADAILYVYSITNRSSFEKARLLADQLELHGKSHLPVMLLGNKREMERGRCVSFKEGYCLARDAGWTFREVSAATDNGKLKEGILEFVRDVQIEQKKLKASRRGRYFRRAVSALATINSNSRQATKEEHVAALPDWTLNLLHVGAIPRFHQRRLTCPAV